MNKKMIIITITSLAVAFVAIGTLFYVRSFKTVHLDIKRADVSASVYQGSSHKLATFGASGDIKLQPGDYIIVTEGKKYENVPTNFTVKDVDMTIPIEPSFSSVYQDEVLSIEQPAITAAIKAAYPTATRTMDIARGNIYRNGEWYATTLSEAIVAGVSQYGDLYRTVLKKEDGKWVIKAKPALVLSASDHPTIPRDILRDINSKR